MKELALDFTVEEAGFICPSSVSLKIQPLSLLDTHFKCTSV